MAALSWWVYQFQSESNDTAVCNSMNTKNQTSRDDDTTIQDTDGMIPSALVCHWYYHDRQYGHGIQVLLASSLSRRYLAIVFAGTDNYQTALLDANIWTTPFGDNGHNWTLPIVETTNNQTTSSTTTTTTTDYYDNARVHAGFNHAVFDHGFMDDLLKRIEAIRLQQRQPPDSDAGLKLYTTGHSLGAAESVLTAVALAGYYHNLSSANDDDDQPQDQDHKPTTRPCHAVTSSSSSSSSLFLRGGGEGGLYYENDTCGAAKGHLTVLMNAVVVVAEQFQRVWLFLRHFLFGTMKHHHDKDNNKDNDKKAPMVTVTSINFGCPCVGNGAFRHYLHNDDNNNDKDDNNTNTTSEDNANFFLTNLGVWRLVLGWDLVPRLPQLFAHVGHTVQLTPSHAEPPPPPPPPPPNHTTRDDNNHGTLGQSPTQWAVVADSSSTPPRYLGSPSSRNGVVVPPPPPGTVKAYYHHYGDSRLNYTSVPWGWNEMPYLWIPGALESHHMGLYWEFLYNYSIVVAGNQQSPVAEKFEWMVEFERVAVEPPPPDDDDDDAHGNNNNKDDNDDDRPPNVDDDLYVHPPDDDFQDE
ncbi:hypothetical protein ACA910_021494 [Epithemia clementina (nom. ined.)]